MKNEKLYRMAIENDCKSVKGNEIQHAPYTRMRFIGEDKSIQFIDNIFKKYSEERAKKFKDVDKMAFSLDNRKVQIKETIMLLMKAYPLYKELIANKFNVQDCLEFASNHVTSNLLRKMPTLNYLSTESLNTVFEFLTNVKREVNFKNVEDDERYEIHHDISRAFSNIVEKDTYEYAQKIAQQEVIEEFSEYTNGSIEDRCDFKEVLSKFLSDLSTENILSCIWDFQDYPTIMNVGRNINEKQVDNEFPYITLPLTKMDEYSVIEIHVFNLDIVPIKLMLLLLMKTYSETNGVIIGNIEYIGQDDKAYRYAFEPVPFRGEVCDGGEISIGDNSINILRSTFSESYLEYFITKAIDVCNWEVLHGKCIEENTKSRIANMLKVYGIKLTKNRCDQLGIPVDPDYIKTTSIFKKKQKKYYSIFK